MVGSDPEILRTDAQGVWDRETRKDAGWRSEMLSINRTADRLEGGRDALGINVRYQMLEFVTDAAIKSE